MMKAKPMMRGRPAAPPSVRAPMRPQPTAYMADGGYVGTAARTCGCVGVSGGTGGTRSNQDYRK